VRPRRRKALRQDLQGQDRLQEEEERLRVRKDFKLRQSRVRYDSREERYYGDFDMGSEHTVRRPLRWGDYEFEEAGSDEFSDQHHKRDRRDQKVTQNLVRRAQQPCPVQRRQDDYDHQKRTVHTTVQQQKRDIAPVSKGEEPDTSLKRFVTFYITNFPPQASNFFLRKGFEICGILEEVFVANTRNRNGEVYGFVRYAKVRDVDKLLKALNNVCFGQYCVCVVLARFDRKVVREDEGVRRKKEEVAGGGAKEGEMEKGLEGEKRKEGVTGRREEGLKMDGGFRKGEEGGVRVGGAGRKEGEGDGGEEVRKASTTKQTTVTIKVLANLHTNGHSDSPPIAKQSTENPTLSETSVCKDGISMEKEKQVTKGINFVEEMTSCAGDSASMAIDQTIATTVGPKLNTTKSLTPCSLGTSGPWSVDWLQNTQEGDKGLISSKNKRLKKVVKANGGNGGRLSNKHGKKKAGGVLRHPVLTFKKVARLPISDREEVMKVLRKSKLMNVVKQKIQNRRRQRERVTRSLEAVNVNSLNESCSLDSVNNDWSNWVALNGSEVSKAADVQCVSFKGNCHNNFSVLSRHKKVALGPVLTPMANERVDV